MDEERLIARLQHTGATSRGRYGVVTVKQLWCASLCAAKPNL